MIPFWVISHAGNPLTEEELDEAQSANSIGNGWELDATNEFDEAQHPRDKDGKFAQGSGVVNTPAFKAWFGDSVVRDKDGKPEVMYHGTNADVTEFRPFSHFGTAKAANDRYEALRSFSEDVVHRDAGPFSIVPVYLKLENPLRMPDLAGVDANTSKPYEEALDDFDKKYPPDDDDISRRFQAIDRGEGPTHASLESDTDLSEYLYRNDVIDSEEFWEVQYSPQKAMELLKAKGYDGIVYTNDVEDTGSDSYIVFDPTHVKSAYNRGAWSQSDKHISNQGIPCGQSWISADKECHEGEAGDATITRGAPKGFEFVSPNVDDNSAIDGAIRELRGARQLALREFAERIDGEFAFSGKMHDAVGDWKDGAENTVVTTYKVAPAWNELRANAALKGIAADQKAVIPFRVAEDGKNILHSVKLPMDLRAARDTVKAAGIEFRTLIPAGAATHVMVYDPDGSLGDRMEKLAHENKTQHIYYRGHGEFLGGDTRDEGVAKYKQAISEYGVDEEGTGPHAKRGLRGSDLTRMQQYAEEKRKYRLSETPSERISQRNASELKVPGESHGMVVLKHWSNVDLTHSTIDPDKHGTGLAGAEAKRKRDYPEIYPSRSYFGLAGYRKEPSLGAKLHTVAVPAKALYDIELDPAGLEFQAREEAATKYGKFAESAADTLAEKKVKDAGYLGYYSRSHRVAAVFDKLPGSGAVKTWRAKYSGNSGEWVSED